MRQVGKKPWMFSSMLVSVMIWGLVLHFHGAQVQGSDSLVTARGSGCCLLPGFAYPWCLRTTEMLTVAGREEGGRA